jgi:hypothetical protein
MNLNSISWPTVAAAVAVTIVVHMVFKKLI